MTLHPMHVRGLQFLVLARTPRAGVSGRSGLDDGFMGEGWHDTVLIMPCQRMRILLPFHDYVGLYLYHCHNLQHEDRGMMRYYRAGA